MEKKVFDNFFLSPALDTYMCNVNKSAKKKLKNVRACIVLETIMFTGICLTSCVSANCV